MYITERFFKKYAECCFIIEIGGLAGIEPALQDLEVEAITPNMTAIAQGLRDIVEGLDNAETQAGKNN